MYLAIFIALAVLSGALLAFSFIVKKRTLLFSVVAVLTAVVCAVGAVLSVQSVKTAAGAEKDEQLYISARLARDGHYLEAIQAAGEALRDHGMSDEVVLIRSLCLNLTSQFSVCVSTAAESANQQVLDIVQASVQQRNVEEAAAGDILEGILAQVQLSDQKLEQLDMIMRLRYLPQGSADIDASVLEGGTTLDMLAKARSSSESGDYEQAYQLAQSMAGEGALADIILVADMFVNNYNQYSFANEDEEMDTLLHRMTVLQAELDRYWVQQAGAEPADVPPEQGDAGEDAGEGASAEAMAYEMMVAELNEASAELTKAPVKRAINYMLASAPQNAEEMLAYNLQMAKLYILAEEFTKADTCLDRIFKGELLNEEQWLGVETMMVLDAFKRYDANPDDADFELYFSILFTCLNQGVVVEQEGFRYTMQEYLLEYLRNLYSGLYIGAVNLAGFPQVQVSASYYDEKNPGVSVSLTAEDFYIYDMYEEIIEFTVEKADRSGLSICFVVDRSGSMQGGPLYEAKNAVQNFISAMQEEENIRYSLVAFESSASVVTPPTDSTSVIRGGVASLATTGGTNILAGLEKGLESLQTETGERIIILLSDGYDGEVNMPRLDALLGSLKAQDIPVYTIGLVGADHEYLGYISSGAGGLHSNAGNPEELSKVYEHIRNLILNRYTITYTAVTEMENEERVLRVGLTDALVYDEKQYALGSTLQALDDEMLLGPQANYYRETGGSNKEAA